VPEPVIEILPEDVSGNVSVSDPDAESDKEALPVTTYLSESVALPLIEIEPDPFVR
jgi:hypothetical protein